jgi:hypothetical protein
MIGKVRTSDHQNCFLEVTVTRVVVTGMTRVIVTVHVVTGVHRVVVCSPGNNRVVRSAGCTAVVSLLNLIDEVMLLIALAFVRWAVAFATRVVVANTHDRVW